MARVTRFFFASAILIITTAAQAVLVSGYAYMTGQSDHANTQVLFEAVSPSAETDTAYTNSEGSFALTVEPGVYDVLYSHDGYAPYRLPNHILLWDTTLDPVTLMPPLSGHLSGTIGPGDFQVTDSIIVDSGQTLTILPGTKLYFEYQKRLFVYGEFIAVGTATDSIIFTRRTLSPDSLWGGVRFLEADNSSRLEYGVIEWASPSDLYWTAGGGILIYACNPTVRYCTVRFNVGHSPSYGGGGICCVSASPRIENCLIAENETDNFVHGGGVYCGSGSPEFSNCVITYNYSNGSGGGVSAGGAAYFVDCTISDNTGEGCGGVTAYDSARFERCLIANNRSGSYGGGIGSSNAATFSECLIVGNTGSDSPYLYGGGGVRCSGGIFTRCTIAGNNAYNGSAALINGPGIFTSCIFASEGDNSVLYFLNGSNSHIEYCDVYSSDGVPFGYYEDDSSRAPLIFGTIIVTNANGDSCDTYYNIFMDPQFADTANGDFHLLAGSPCIDAGDPELLNDPDGTVADIGAFYFNQLDAEANFIPHPSSFILSAYPNPFNSATRISFDLPRNEFVELSVYDIGGRRIATLLAEPMTPGRHAVNFDASALPSGIYFSRLQGGGFSQTKKIVLIK